MTPGLRLALAGGGTGGHIVPGLHLADGLCERGTPPADLLWFHGGRPVEERVFAALPRRVVALPLERVALAVDPPGGGAPGPARLLLRTPGAFRRARERLRAHGSGVLLGLGGYTTLPAVLAARSLGIPVALLEINATPGRATRALAPLARVVFHAWRGTLPERPGTKHLLVGAPLGPRFRPVEEGGRRAARARLGVAAGAPLLVVLGGSQGAGGLNAFVRAHAPAWLDAGLEVLHQVGPSRLGEGAAGARGYRAVEYLEDVPTALAAADLVLCRGGASTLAELAASATPAWVVPYPHHPDRHQERNAAELGGGVRIVPEADLDGDLAAQLVRALGPAGAEARACMRAALLAERRDGAVERIAAALEALVTGAP